MYYKTKHLIKHIIKQMSSEYKPNKVSRFFLGKPVILKTLNSVYNSLIKLSMYSQGDEVMCMQHTHIKHYA